MSTTHTLQSSTSSGAGLQAFETLAVAAPDGGGGRSFAILGVLTETVAFDAFTDGGAAAGTYVMAGSLPAGAVVLGSKVTVAAGFAGDTSATLTIGDGSDVDRYNTGTPSVFATAAAGIESGAPSGNKLVTTANRPTLTITSAADFTAVNAGSLTVNLYFIQTA